MVCCQEGVLIVHTPFLPDNLASCKGLFADDLARLTEVPLAAYSGTVRRMKKTGLSRQKEKKPPSALQIRLAARLGAVMAELGKGPDQMADFVGAGRTTFTNWLKMENLPAEDSMIRLCDKTRLTMEWFYRERGEGVPLGLLIRLELRLAGIDPDKATPEQVAETATRVALPVLASASA